MIRHRERDARRSERYETEYEEPRRGSGIKQIVVLVTVAFMITLGVVVGTRLSSDAIAVLLGVIAGVAASIPCALLLMAVTRRREERDVKLYGAEHDRYEGRERDGPRRDDPRRAVPPVIVVTQGQAPQQLAPWATGQANWNAWEDGSRPRSQRQFRVMGYDESDDDE